MKQRNKALKWLAVLGVKGIAVLSASPAMATSSAIMETTGFTSQPIGHYEYCQQNPMDCSIRARTAKPMALSRERWDEMVRINATANASVRPVTDLEYFGTKELWILPTSYGDCEDYALLKRKMLMDRGWPASTLLVTVVRQRNGEGHAVLTVRTDRGDFILDNLEGRILLWNKTEYAYLKRQAAAHSGKWEGIIDRRDINGSLTAVGSVK